MEKTTTLLHIKDSVIMTLSNNKLCIKVLGNISENGIKLLIKNTELFYTLCKTKKKKFYHIYDLSEMGFINSQYYLKYSDQFTTFLKEYSDFFIEHLHGSVIVTGSDFSRGIANLVLSFYKAKRPVKFVSSVDEIDFDFTL